MLDAYMRRVVDPPLDRIGRRLAAAGISANAVMVFGFAIGLLTIPCVAVACLVSIPWITLLLVGAAYIGSIPWSISTYGKLSRQRPTVVADDIDSSRNTPAI